MFRQVLHNYIVYHRQRACPKSSWPSYALWSKGQTLCTYMYEHEQVGIMSWLLLSRHYNKFNFIVITYSLAQLFDDNRSDFMIINTCCKLQTIFLIKKKRVRIVLTSLKIIIGRRYSAQNIRQLISYYVHCKLNYRMHDSDARKATNGRKWYKIEKFYRGNNLSADQH